MKKANDFPQKRIFQVNVEEVGRDERRYDKRRRGRERLHHRRQDLQNTNSKQPHSNRASGKINSMNVLDNRQQAVFVECLQRHLLREIASVLHDQAEEVENGAPARFERFREKPYKFNHIFCWNIEIPLFPFISFSIITPANPARLEEQIVSTAGATGRTN